MARPTAETIVSTELEHYVLDILESDGYWTICYRGQPVSIRHRFYTAEGIRMKYPRTGFNNQAHCERLAGRLNAHFNCDDFSCRELTTA